MIMNKDKDFWAELTDAQKKEVELGLKQIQQGQTEDWDDFRKRVSQAQADARQDRCQE